MEDTKVAVTIKSHGETGKVLLSLEEYYSRDIIAELSLSSQELGDLLLKGGIYNIDAKVSNDFKIKQIKRERDICFYTPDEWFSLSQDEKEELIATHCANTFKDKKSTVKWYGYDTQVPKRNCRFYRAIWYEPINK